MGIEVWEWMFWSVEDLGMKWRTVGVMQKHGNQYVPWKTTKYRFIEKNECILKFGNVRNVSTQEPTTFLDKKNEAKIADGTIAV